MSNKRNWEGDLVESQAHDIVIRQQVTLEGDNITSALPAHLVVKQGRNVKICAAQMTKFDRTDTKRYVNTLEYKVEFDRATAEDDPWVAFQEKWETIQPIEMSQLAQETKEAQAQQEAGSFKRWRPPTPFSPGPWPQRSTDPQNSPTDPRIRRSEPGTSGYGRATRGEGTAHVSSSEQARLGRSVDE